MPDELEAQTDLFQDYVDLWTNTARRMMGEDVEPLAKPAPGDNRFKHPEWNTNPYFDYCKQFYLLSTSWAEAMLDETEGLSERDRQRAEFTAATEAGASPDEALRQVVRHLIDEFTEDL